MSRRPGVLGLPRHRPRRGAAWRLSGVSALRRHRPLHPVPVRPL